MDEPKVKYQWHEFCPYQLCNHNSLSLSKVVQIYVTGSGPSALARALPDAGELNLSTERDSSFPRSTPGAVPSVPTRIQESISSSQPVYGQAGGYEKHKRQYLTHNV